MPIAAEFAIELDQYASYNLPLQWLSANVAVDLSNCTANLAVRDNSGNLVVEFGTGDNTVALGGNTGYIWIQLPPTVTGALDPVTNAYDLLLTFPTGFKQRLMEGPFVVRKGQTNT